MQFIEGRLALDVESQATSHLPFPGRRQSACACDRQIDRDPKSFGQPVENRKLKNSVGGDSPSNALSRLGHSGKRVVGEDVVHPLG